MQRKFEEDIFAVKMKMAGSTNQEGNFIGQFVHDLLSEIAFIVFKKDNDGNILYSDKGFPVVDWKKVLLNVGNILGKIVGVMLATRNASIKKLS